MTEAATGSEVRELRVPGIHCDGCAASIRDVLGALSGVTLVGADAVAKTITVAFDPARAALADIERTRADGGFPADAPEPSGSRPGAGVVLWAVAAGTALALAGYALGFAGFVYGLMLPNSFGRFGAVTVGVVAGTAAFFSPCVFPLLPGYVSWCLVRPDADGRAGAPLGLVRPGAAAASPFHGDIRDETVPILTVRLLAGAVIAAMGVRALARGGLGSRLLARFGARFARPRPPGRPLRGFYLYGLTYNAAGLGCTGPILLGLMLYYALISREALVAFGAFTATMGLLMFGVTVAVGRARERLLGRLRRAMPAVQRAGGAVLLALGVYTMAIQSFSWGREAFVRIFTRYVL